MSVTTPDGLSDLDVVRSALQSEYDVIAELGRGGMAVVYRARERDLERDVALKVLPFTVAFNTELVERFQREAKTAAQLEHPHIIPIYRVGRSGQVIYFVMKYLRGESLSSLLERRGVLAPRDVRRMLVETGSALGYAASRGVVHRDVKPDNIMLDEGGRHVVTDFGIARSLAGDARLTAAGMTLGTPRYMSPEQARAKHVDGRSDLYSLGCVAYECLTGRPPFEGDDAVAILLDHINTPLPLPVLATGEQQALYGVIERMLAKDPDDRFQSAQDLLDALDELGSGTARGSAPGRRSLTPTRAAPAVGATAVIPSQDDTRSANPIDSSIDRLLDAGIRGIRAQKPLLNRGVAGLRAQKPALARTIARVRTFAADQRPRIDAAIRGASARARGAWTRVHQLGPRAWIGAAVTLLVLTGGYYGVHFATAHRSRCPAPAAAAPAAANASGTDATPLSLLLDPVSTRSAGSDLDVYYDVCGLSAATPFTTNIAVTRNVSGIRRIITGTPVRSVTSSHAEKARGPATRRHRTISLEGLPTGAYTLGVSIVDNRGRRRERSVEFLISD